MAGTLAGFDPDQFRDGIHLVQEFFTPGDRRATFHFPNQAPTSGTVDSENVPFDPASDVVLTPTKDPVVAACSIEYQDTPGGLENLGYIVSSRIIVTLLDVDYAKVEGFEYLVMNGTRYYYRSTDLPAALGTVEVWSIRCLAEDES